MSDKHPTSDRYPAVAGQFYPANPDSLQKELTKHFAAAAPKMYEQVRAIITPHAGYVFSGTIAASAFNQIDKDVDYKRVFLIASSHQIHFEGASIYCDGDFLMPYGKDEVDTVFGKMLVKCNPELFTDDPLPHSNEHSIEVQLPFLHYVLNGKYKIVPIVLGTADHKTCRHIASVLKPYLTKDNLFVISSDFSHYPDYDNAKSVDLDTEKAILSNDPKHLMTVLSENAGKHIPRLATSLCGWTSVLTLLYMTEGNESFHYKGVKYSNSGDAELYGEHDRVVGYWAIALTEIEDLKKEEFSLSGEEKQQLLKEARRAIENLFWDSEKPALDINTCSPALKTKCGAFVSLHKKDGSLRGCIGQMVSDKPLLKVVHDKAIWAAINDSRFSPLTEDELDDVDIEISVLSPMKKIQDISEIEMGVHGIYISQGYCSGVFLPQVATETGWDKETFLGHCARDKAGIGWEGWKDADIYIFTATIFSEKDNSN